MSKSLGNTIAIRELLEQYSPNALRLYFYSKHYRSDFDFSEKELDKFQRFDGMIAGGIQTSRRSWKLARKFFKRIEDDFDTPGALTVLLEAARERSVDLEVMVSVFGLRY
jgi:cysteinyl-tRNA synthetase